MGDDTDDWWDPKETLEITIENVDTINAGAGYEYYVKMILYNGESAEDVFSFSSTWKMGFCTLFATVACFVIMVVGAFLFTSNILYTAEVVSSSLDASSEPNGVWATETGF